VIKSRAFVAQLPALLGVLVGVVMTFVLTSTGERTVEARSTGALGCCAAPGAAVGAVTKSRRQDGATAPPQE